MYSRKQEILICDNCSGYFFRYINFCEPMGDQRHSPSY